MSQAPVHVADWMNGASTFAPRMTVQLSVPPADALGIVADGLAAQGFKIGYRADDGFRARYRDLSSLFELDLFRCCVLRVLAAPSGTGSALSIEVEEGGEHRSGRRRGREGLTAALLAAQRRGITVSTTPWE